MENPSIDLLAKACADPRQFVAQRFDVENNPEPLHRWQARAVQAAIRGLASEDEITPYGIRIRQRLSFRVIAATLKGDDLFGTAPISISPGESITWQYPEDGIKVETDIPLRLTP